MHGFSQRHSRSNPNRLEHPETPRTQQQGSRPGRKTLHRKGVPPREAGRVRIVFDDDFSLMAGARQPWVTLTHSRRFKMHRKRLQLPNWTSMLMPLFTEDIRSCPTHERGLTLRESMHSIPLALPLRLPERSLRIDPYVLDFGWATELPQLRPSRATPTTSPITAVGQKPPERDGAS